MGNKRIGNNRLSKVNYFQTNSKDTARGELDRIEDGKGLERASRIFNTKHEPLGGKNKSKGVDSAAFEVGCALKNTFQDNAKDMPTTMLNIF